MEKNGESIARNVIDQNLSRIDERGRVREDSALQRSDKSNLAVHNRYYTKLLKAYVSDYEESAKIKQDEKKQMLEVARNLMTWVPIMTLLLVMLTIWCIGKGKMQALEVLPEIIIAAITVVANYWTIPKMITRYMFNKKEDENLACIISKIQDYDRDIRGQL